MAEPMRDDGIVIEMKLNDDQGLWVCTVRWQDMLAFAIAHPDKACVTPIYLLLLDAWKAGPNELIGVILGLKAQAVAAGAAVTEARTNEGNAALGLLGEPLKLDPDDE